MPLRALTSFHERRERTPVLISLWTSPALCTAARQPAKSWNMCRMAGKSRFAVRHLHKQALFMLVLQASSELCATN